MSPRWFVILGLVLSAAIGGTIALVAFCQSETAYFLVARPTLYPKRLGDSYILPLTDPDDIDTARLLIDSGTFKIVHAVIAAGSDGINRDMLAEGTPEWSWHVVKFMGFSDLAIELCDGSPTLTEGDVQNWDEGEEGMICYWSYTVVAEVTELVHSEPATWGEIKIRFDNH